MIFKIARMWRDARQSPFKTFSEKWEVFRVLCTLAWKYRQTGDVNKEVSHKIFGYTISAYNYGTMLFLFREIFLTQEYYFETDQKAPRILDCGANIGMAINVTNTTLLKLNIDISFAGAYL